MYNFRHDLPVTCCPEQNLTMLPTRLVRFFPSRPVLGATLSALCILSSGPAGADYVPGSLAQPVIVEPDPSQTRIIKLVNYVIEKAHYLDIELDDDMSKRIFDRYIDLLDPSKLFFLAGDIRHFQEQDLHRQLDDDIKVGRLDAAFDIFNLYQQRVHERIEFALTRLDRPFDFTIDEKIEIDRQNSDWADSADAIDDYWRKRIKNDIINLRLSDKEEAEIRELLSKRYTNIADQSAQVDANDVFEIFVNTYAGAVDPNTNYYSPIRAENFRIQMSLSLQGIGAVLQLEDGYVVVKRIIPGGPVERSGELKPDDRIIGVGQEDGDIVDVVGWKLDDVVKLIRGPKHTVVRLEILPAETGLTGKSRITSLTRDNIRLEEQAARSNILEIDTERGPSKIGLVSLPTFYTGMSAQSRSDSSGRSTTQDVRKLVEDLKGQDIDGLIINLRGNGGGALTEAINLTGLFIPDGPVVQIQNASGHTEIDYDKNSDIVYGGPLMVLVDRYSASASEIFSGAIQDYNRGLVVGEPTYGKGTVQNIVNLNNLVKSDDALGQVKITTGQFFRINGDSTQYRGVIPDIMWTTNRNVEGYDDDHGERGYENPIPWRRINEARYYPYQSEVPQPVIDQVIDNHENRVTSSPYFTYTAKINDLYRENLAQERVSLSESVRKKENRQHNEQLEVFENSRKEALEFLQSDSDRLINLSTNQPDTVESDESAEYLIEAAHILLDSIHIQRLAGGYQHDRSRRES